MKLSGASRDQLEQQGRKKRNGVPTVPAVRVAKVKIALRNNVSVVLTAQASACRTWSRCSPKRCGRHARLPSVTT